MFFRDTIDLINVTTTVNDIGNIVETETSRTVFADKGSIKQSEFYQAMAQGLKPELTFIIRTIEYENEPMLEYNSKPYTIIRTYEKDEFIELICQGGVNNATT